MEDLGRTLATVADDATEQLGFRVNRLHDAAGRRWVHGELETGRA